MQHEDVQKCRSEISLFLDERFYFLLPTLESRKIPGNAEYLFMAAPLSQGRYIPCVQPDGWPGIETPVVVISNIRLLLPSPPKGSTGVEEASKTRTEFGGTPSTEAALRVLCRECPTENLR